MFNVKDVLSVFLLVISWFQILHNFLPMNIKEVLPRFSGKKCRNAKPMDVTTPSEQLSPIVCIDFAPRIVSGWSYLISYFFSWLKFIMIMHVFRMISRNAKVTSYSIVRVLCSSMLYRWHHRMPLEVSWDFDVCLSPKSH